MKNIIEFSLFEMIKFSNFIDTKKEVITYIYTNKKVQKDLNSLNTLLLKKYGKGKLNLFPDFFSEDKNEILNFFDEVLFYDFEDFGCIFTLYTYTSPDGKNLAAIDLNFDDQEFRIGKNINNKDEDLKMSNELFKETNVKLIWNKIFNRIKSNI